MSPRTSAWTFSASAGVGKDDYDDSYFGLQESSFRSFTLAADYQPAERARRRRQLQLRALLGPAAVAVGEPRADARSGHRPESRLDRRLRGACELLLDLRHAAQIRRNTEARFSYDYATPRATTSTASCPGGPLPPPSQLPKVFNKLQQLHVDVRHRLSSRLAATLSYLYEPFDVYDFAFDPSVVNSIVQPSSLVLGLRLSPVHRALGVVRLAISGRLGCLTDSAISGGFTCRMTL